MSGYNYSVRILSKYNDNGNSKQIIIWKICLFYNI